MNLDPSLDSPRRHTVRGHCEWLQLIRCVTFPAAGKTAPSLIGSEFRVLGQTVTNTGRPTSTPETWVSTRAHRSPVFLLETSWLGR